jgi:hypothetical protein
MGAPRRSTPPRSAGRGRNKPPVARERTSRTRTGPQRRQRKSSGKKTKARKTARTQTRNKRQGRGGRSFVAKMAFMALLGYALVLSVDVLPRLVPDEAGPLWDKLVDRWLDNDVPRTQKEAPRVAPKKAAKKTPAKPPARNVTPPAAPAPPAPVKKVKTAPRADYEAPRPDAYARESRSLSEERARKAKQRRKRLDSLIDQVTSDL